MSFIVWPTNDEIKQQYLCASGFSDRFYDYRTRLLSFMQEHIYPWEEQHMEAYHMNTNTASRWMNLPGLEELKAKAKAAGLWNLFLPVDSSSMGAKLTNLEYAPLCEIMGSSHVAPEVFNCSAPDTGNMEVLARYASPELQQKFLQPLLRGEIRSCFGMTEPAVASSDATNIQCSIRREGDEYVVNGRKWWTSGAMDPRCTVCILMGESNPNADAYRRQSMIVVPMDLPGIEKKRYLTVFGYDDAPHGHAEVVFTNVRVPASYILKGEGCGFEIAQGRLGPGRIHHCMRAVGAAERALAIMIRRASTRQAFGKEVLRQGKTLENIALSRTEIEQCRLLTLQAAHMMDTVGNKVAKQYIAMIKVAAPQMLQDICERAIQTYGAGGVCQDTPLPYMWVMGRVLKIADGPSEVHNQAIAKEEIKRQLKVQRRSKM